MTLADAVSVGLLECRHGRIAWVNRRVVGWAEVEGASALVGRDPESLISDAGQGLPDWISGEDGAPPPGRVECALVAPCRPPRRVRLRALGDGLWELEDVNGLRQAEAELVRLASELMAANRDVASLRERLERESKDREELLSVVSHELQTPLTVISGFTRLLLTGKVGPLNDEQRHFLSESAKSCRRLSGFINSLMDAEGETDRGRPLELAEGSLASTIEGVVDMLRPLVHERRQRVKLALEGVADRARFDPMRIEQVLINLLSNALKYGREGGEISVSTRVLEAAGRHFVEVAVSDDGPGIPEGDRERIFEPYVRAGTTEGEGLGLGLAICHRIVSAHHGSLGVDESPRGGARFWFTLQAAARR